MNHALMTGIGIDEEGERVFIGEAATIDLIAAKLRWYLNNLLELDIRIVMENEEGD